LGSAIQIIHIASKTKECVVVVRFLMLTWHMRVLLNIATLIFQIGVDVLMFPLESVAYG
jgi:hypothetical protein